jgi:beta-glucosidase
VTIVRGMPDCESKRRAVARSALGALAGLLVGLAPRLAAAQTTTGPCPGPTLGGDGAAPAQMPWLDPSLAPETRTELLLAEMTLEEKVDLATGELCLIYGYYNAGIVRLGIPALTMADGPAGVRIPYRRVNGGRATQLPAPIAVAATWDVAAAAQQGELLGTEALATGHNVLLGPTLDLARTPLGGRNFEGFGEDPLLVARLAVPLIQAIQRFPVLADAKHFAVYNQENDRFSLDARLDPRTLRELHLRPFEAAVREGHVATVMCGFNRVNGVHACEHAGLLTDVLKGELGFDGFVLSDWGATRSTVDAALAGLDQEQAHEEYFGWKLLDAVEHGEVPAAVADDKARRILLPMFRFGLFDHPVGAGDFPEAEHGQRSARIAEEGVVLLKNAGELLPLSTQVSSIAVIGADAANGSAQGGGAARVEPTYTVSALDAIRRRAGPGVRVEHAEGTDPVVAAHLYPAPPAIPSSVLTPPDADAGAHGLRGEYWKNTRFDGPPEVVRVDRQVAAAFGFFNYPSVNASSVPALPAWFSLSRFSARWTGTFTPPETGAYTLTLTSRGRGWVYLDGAAVIDHSETHTLASRSATVELVAGEPHALRVDYVADDPEIGVGIDLGGDVALGWEPPTGTVPPAVRDAAALAARSDVAIVVVRDYESEGRDRPDLSLPNGQDQLIREVVAANPRTVLVLATGQPVAMPWLESVTAIVQAWYPGQEQGEVIARLLFGDVTPSGKLPVTFPRTLAETPAAASDGVPAAGEGPRAATYSEGVLVGYRWYDANGVDPLFPFGYGLSYTTFRFDDLEIERAGAPLRAATAPEEDGTRRPARVAFTVTNTGAHAGAEVAQLYVGSCPGHGPAAPRQLAGFAKVRLAPGEKERVVLDVAPESLSYWSVDEGTWVAPACDLPVFVGSSSRDIRLEGAIRMPGAAAGDDVEPQSTPARGPPPAPRGPSPSPRGPESRRRPAGRALRPSGRRHRPYVLSHGRARTRRRG